MGCAGEPPVLVGNDGGEVLVGNDGGGCPGRETTEGEVLVEKQRRGGGPGRKLAKDARPVASGQLSSVHGLSWSPS